MGTEHGDVPGNPSAVTLRLYKWLCAVLMARDDIRNKKRNNNQLTMLNCIQ